MHYIIGSVISMSRSPKWRRGYTTDSSQANGKAIDATSGCSLLWGPANTTGWSGSLVPKKNKRNERERERGGGSLPFKLERDCVATLTMPLQMHNVIATRKRKYKRKTYLPDEYWRGTFVSLLLLRYPRYYWQSTTCAIILPLPLYIASSMPLPQTCTPKVQPTGLRFFVSRAASREQERHIKINTATASAAAPVTPRETQPSKPITQFRHYRHEGSIREWKWKKERKAPKMFTQK